MRRVVLSLGSNIEREKNISTAVREIASRYEKIEVSPVYETDSVGFVGEPFFNLVIGFCSDQVLEKIRNEMRSIEAAAGRIRGRKSFDNRVLDIDVILYGDEVLHPKYNIPRDEIENYAYVLKPLSDLYPHKCHPHLGLSYAEMWQAFDVTGQGLRRVSFDPLLPT